MQWRSTAHNRNTLHFVSLFKFHKYTHRKSNFDRYPYFRFSFAFHIPQQYDTLSAAGFHKAHHPSLTFDTNRTCGRSVLAIPLRPMVHLVPYLLA